MADLKLSPATTAGTADTSSADIAAAMADIGIAVDAVALSLETTMASVDATMSLAAADVAVHAGDMAASMDVVAGAADTADTAFLGLSTGGLAIVAAAVIGTGAVLFDLGSKYQDATNKLAAGADFSVNAANKIGTAFTNQAFSTTFSAQSTMEFHSAVACPVGLGRREGPTGVPSPGCHEERPGPGRGSKAPARTGPSFAVHPSQSFVCCVDGAIGSQSKSGITLRGRVR